MSRFAPRTEPKPIPEAAWNDAPLYCLQVNGEWLSHVIGALNVLDQPDAWLGDDDEIFAARQQVNEIILKLMENCDQLEYSFWETPTPDNTDSDDGAAVELGFVFHTSIAGNIVGLRFHKGIENTGTHTGHLFAHDGTLLGSLEFTDETDEGWQMARFDTSIAIDAYTDYIASYHAPFGSYSYTRPFFEEPFATPPLYASRSSDDSVGNGRYGYGDAGTFPDNSFDTSNYFVDVIFIPENFC